MKILLIEDEQDLARFVKKILENAGNSVTWFPSLQEVLGGSYDWDHDLIILDLMLPDKPGSFLLEELRRLKISIPILVLSAKHDIDTKASLLNLGADDYLTKPFDARELLARINAISRRSFEMDHGNELVFADMIFYRKQNKVVRGDKEVQLTKREGELLDILFRHRGQIVRTQDILNKIWHAGSGFHSNIVQATVYRLRAKIDTGFKQRLIHSIHGVGYKLSTES